MHVGSFAPPVVELAVGRESNSRHWLPTIGLSYVMKAFQHAVPFEIGAKTLVFLSIAANNKRSSRTIADRAKPRCPLSIRPTGYVAKAFRDEIGRKRLGIRNRVSALSYIRCRLCLDRLLGSESTLKHWREPLSTPPL